MRIEGSHEDRETRKAYETYLREWKDKNISAKQVCNYLEPTGLIKLFGEWERTSRSTHVHVY